MNDEELIRKLENTKTPEIELSANRQRLKEDLISAGYPERQNSFFLWSRRCKNIIINSLGSRQPIWKTGIVSAAGLATVIIVGILLPSLRSDSVYASAVEIINSNPEIRAIFEKSENQSDILYKVLVLDTEDAIPVGTDIYGEIITGYEDREPENAVITFSKEPSIEVNTPGKIVITFPAGAKLRDDTSSNVSDKYSVVKLSATKDGEYWEIYLVVDKEKLGSR